MKHSLRWKLTSSYLLLVVFSLSVAAAYLIPAITQFYLQAYQRDILNRTVMIARMLEAYQEDGVTLARLDEIAGGLAWRQGVYIGVRDTAGHALATSRWNTDTEGPVPPEVASALRDHPDTAIRYDAPREEDRLFAAAPLRPRGVVGGVVQVSVPRAWVDWALRPAWMALGTALLLGAAAAWVLGAWRARALSAPVLELAGAARRISAGDFTRRASVRADDEIGQLAGAFNTMADQLSQKLAAVSDERSKIEAIISSMNDAVVAVDAQDAILLLNRAAQDLLELPAEARGQSLRSQLGDDHPLWRCLDATRSRRTDVEEELRGEGTGTSGERILEVHATPLRSTGGTASGAVAVIRDVTDLRRNERARRELTANVSHELRTPLTSIKGFAETLLAGAIADHATCRRFVEIIDSEATRLMKLVDDLMDLSRLEFRAVALEPTSVRLDELAAEALGKMRPQAERHGVALRLDGVTPQTVIADRDRILQVLTNLLDNAIKFTPEGGAVDVAVVGNGDQAVISVSDAGPGIPEEHLPRIFDRFYRVERSRSREAGGTGLGLAIAKHIVEAHGGQISVTSRPGQGSVFRVALRTEAQSEV
jgi:two-component system, OmpR family, phosphate regulon sensor histidine kinase PhoR